MRFRTVVVPVTTAVVLTGAAGIAAADTWIPSPPACLNTLNVYDLHVGSDNGQPQFLVAAVRWHNCSIGDPYYQHYIDVRISFNGVTSPSVKTLTQGEPGDHVTGVSWPAGPAEFGAVVVTASAVWAGSDESTTATNTHPFSLRPVDG